jgi:hypothetical protein
MECSTSAGRNALARQADPRQASQRGCRASRRQQITPGLPPVAKSCEGEFCQTQKGASIGVDHQRADAPRLQSGMLKIVKFEHAFPGPFTCEGHTG